MKKAIKALTVIVILAVSLFALAACNDVAQASGTEYENFANLAVNGGNYTLKEFSTPFDSLHFVDEVNGGISLSFYEAVADETSYYGECEIYWIVLSCNAVYHAMGYFENNTATVTGKVEGGSFGAAIDSKYPAQPWSISSVTEYFMGNAIKGKNRYFHYTLENGALTCYSPRFYSFESGEGYFRLYNVGTTVLPTIIIP